MNVLTSGYEYLYPPEITAKFEQDYDLQWFLSELHPLETLKNLDKRYSFMRFRYPITSEYFIWGMPCKEAVQGIKDLVKTDKCLEIYAGTGYLSKWLIEANVQLVSTDIKEQTEYYQWFNNMHYIEASQALRVVDAKYVILSWPTYDCNSAYQAIQYMKPGQKLIYIGEGFGGCTADDMFHGDLEDQSKWKEIEHTIPWFRYSAIHDSIYIYERLESPTK